MLIKICGMTSKQDIELCVNHKIDIVGFLLQPQSKQYNRADMLDYEVAKELISYVPKGMDSCLLIHVKDINKIISTLMDLNPTMIQIQKQSELSLGNLKQIKETFPNIKIIKTFYIEEDIDIKIMLSDINMYINSNLINFVLLDSAKGGSGETHNWDISTKIVNEIANFPIIIAGGLNPSNVKNAIEKIKPIGVDVMSGVSTKRYSKDNNKLNLFLKNSKTL